MENFINPNPPTNGQPLLLLQGMDSLYLSFYPIWSPGRDLWDELAELKVRASMRRGKGLVAEAFGSERFVVQPYGNKPYTYVLTNQDFEVRLGERIVPGCYVVLRSLGLWKHGGAEALIDRVQAWLESLSAREGRPASVSRADWCFDYHLREADFAEENFVTQAAKTASWREFGKAQTFQIGKGDRVVRVYDKVAEVVQQSNKAWFFDLWKRSSDVWRVEFQIRREALTEAGIDTFSDLAAAKGDLLAATAAEFCSLRVPTADSNRSRWPLHPLWQAVITDIAEMEKTGLLGTFDMARALDWRLSKQARSLYGALKGLAAVHAALKNQDAPPSIEALILSLLGILEPHHNDAIWKQDVQAKMDALEYGLW